MPQVNNFNYIEFNQYRAAYLKNGADRSMVVNGSVTPVEFSYSPPAGFDFLVSRLAGHMIDNKTMNADTFGGIATVLTNGVRIYLKGPDDIETSDFLDGTTLQRNGDFDAFFTTTSLLSNRGMGFRWESFGIPARLRENNSFAVSIEDDLSSLIHFEMILHGVMIPTEGD